jgi:hypothetical protein
MGDTPKKLLPSLKVKDAAVGTALHEFAESYFPQYLAYR